MAHLTDDQPYDEEVDFHFTQVAQKLSGIEPLLDAFCSFLHRKTDFYVQYEKERRTAKMGFPPGVAEKIFLKSFRKLPFKQYKEDEFSESPPSISLSSSSLTSSSSVVAQKVLPASPSADISFSSFPSPSPLHHKPIAPSPTPMQTENGKQMPFGNGGFAERYYWTQTLTEATVYVDLHLSEAVRGKNIRCEITARHIVVKVFDEVYIDGDLEDPVKVDDSMWTLSTAIGEVSQIVITLEKSRKNWWKHIVVTDPEIDTTKVDSTQKIGEYDPETQAAIRKIMAEQREKMSSLKDPHFDGFSNTTP